MKYLYNFLAFVAVMLWMLLLGMIASTFGMLEYYAFFVVVMLFAWLTWRACLFIDNWSKDLNNDN